MSERPQRLPELIEPLQLARAGRVLAGRVPVARLRRLASALSEHEGTVEVALEFGRDEVGNPCIRGSLTTELTLVCQRCLEPMRLPMNCEVRLGLVRSEVEVQRLDRGYEPLLVGDEAISLSALVEDELLLALPTVARHPDGRCAIDEQYRPRPEEGVSANGDRPNPFAVLERIKKHD